MCARQCDVQRLVNQKLSSRCVCRDSSQIWLISRLGRTRPHVSRPSHGRGPWSRLPCPQQQHPAPPSSLHSAPPRSAVLHCAAGLLPRLVQCSCPSTR